MTTYTDFQPSTQQAFQFQPTLDGNVYTVIVTWNLFGARYYINVYSLDGTLILCTALAGSPTGVAIESLDWGLGQVFVTTSVPHNYDVGDTLELSIAGCEPDAYNGAYRCLVTGPDKLVYPLSTDPGAATSLGVVNYDISMVEQYFASTLVFREASSQFEVSP